MENGKRDLWVLLRSGQQDQQSLDSTVECLHKILVNVERNDVFCRAHELVKRNRITNNARKILNAVTTPELKAFHFLINKN